MENTFPLLRKVTFTDIRCRPGTKFFLEVQCEGLPASVDPIVHIMTGTNGASVHETVGFSTPLHPSHIPGVDLQADDILSKNDPGELALGAAQRLEPRASLLIAYAVEMVRFTLTVRGSHDLSIAVPYRTLRYLLDTSPPPVARPAKKRKKIPAPKASRVRKAASAS